MIVLSLAGPKLWCIPTALLSLDNYNLPFCTAFLFDLLKHQVLS